MNLKPLLFALAVTFSMNGIDILFHLLEGTAVHLNYVAVKFSLIFLTVILLDYTRGKGVEQCTVTSILGPLVFYAYYLAATPTLDRSIFSLDENAWYVVVHATALALSYSLLYGIQTQPQAKWRSLGKGVLTSLVFVPFFVGMHMAMATPMLVDNYGVFGSFSLLLALWAILLPGSTLFFMKKPQLSMIGGAFVLVVCVEIGLLFFFEALPFPVAALSASLSFLLVRYSS